jgi:predicted porin
METTMEQWMAMLACCAGTLGCGSAAAQSSVQTYGLLDLNVGYASNFSAPGDGVVRVSSGGMNTSRLGFRGSEDLGDGLKAVFQLETGIAVDSGAADTPLFKRQANVGVEGRYGRLVLGRSFTVVYDFMLAYDPMGYAPFYSWAPAGNASGTSRYGMTLAFDNMVKYTGKMGKLTFGANYGAGEQASTADGAKGGIVVNYASGPYSIVATWERANGNTVAPAASRGATTAWHLGAMYSRGKLKFQAAAREYGLAGSMPDVRARLYWAGGNYSATPVVTLAAAVYYQDVRNVAADTDPVMYVIRARHALSKRTDLYVTAAHARAKNGRTVGLSREDAGYGSHQHGVVAGIQHRF